MQQIINCNALSHEKEYKNDAVSSFFKQLLFECFYENATMQYRKQLQNRTE